MNNKYLSVYKKHKTKSITLEQYIILVVHKIVLGKLSIKNKNEKK